MNVRHVKSRQSPERRAITVSDSRRLLIAAVLASLGLLIPILLATLYDLRDVTALIMFASMFAAGVVGRKWVTIPIAIAAFAVTGIMFELGYIAIRGAEEWERANAEHLGESGSVAAKVLGQSFEYVVFGVLLSILTVIGILVRRYVNRKSPGEDLLTT